MIEILVYPADEVEKEIDGLMDNFKEMELQKDEKIKQLKKEKEWLILEYAIILQRNNQSYNISEWKENIKERMQQVLKEK